MKKIIILVSLLFVCHAEAFIQRLQEDDLLNLTRFDELGQDHGAVYITNLEHKPGILELTFELPSIPYFSNSVSIPRGPGSFDNISNMSDIGRHNIQWKLSILNDTTVKMNITGKKGTVYNLYLWIKENKTLRPYFENEIDLGSIENFGWQPKSSSSYIQQAKKIFLKYSCPSGKIKKTICPGKPKIPYYRINDCWENVSNAEWNELYSHMPKLSNVNAQFLSDSLCLELAPNHDLRKGLSIMAMQRFYFGDGISEVIIPAHIWRKYEILL
ncbi:MAG: hypothetical protein KC493_16770 [Bacteriovoracaceae bacterium]|nr:hypothetical protein [Bacteriovoracaceae bacterium]